MSRNGWEQLAVRLHPPLRLAGNRWARASVGWLGSGWAPRLRAIAVASMVLLLFSAALAKEKYQHPGPVHLDRKGERWAEKTLKKMSPEEKVGQLFMIWVRIQFLNLDSPDYRQLRDTIRRDHIGSLGMTVPLDGPFLIKSEPYEAAMLLNQLQRDSPLPLLIAADFERGLAMRLNGTTNFPHAMALGATGNLNYAESFGRIVAQEARAIGVDWNFFPVADVNSNPANPIINTRSFGSDPQLVGDMVAAFIRGAHAGGMLATAKHFPGHGDTATDSHLGVAQVNGDLPRLHAIELPPFARAIAAGVDSVMVAHVSAPALEPDPDRVATTSPAIVTNLLKKQLGFQGLVVTDALDMGALTRLYANRIGRAAVDAFLAGNDLLLIPADLEASYQAMLQAVKSREISSDRLNASVVKILQAKASLGLEEARLVEVDRLARLVGKPENIALAQQIADDAVTLVRDNGRLLPLKAVGTVSSSLPYQTVESSGNRVLAVIFSDDMRLESGRGFERQLRARVPEVTVIYVDPRTAGPMSGEVLKAVDQAEQVIAALYVIPTAGKIADTTGAALKNSVAMASASGALLENVLARAAGRTAVVALGNPYLASDFPQIENYLCTFSNASVSELSAVKALFGEIPIRGHLPVSIPNIAQRGAGIMRPPRVASGDSRHAQFKTPVP